MLPQFARKRKSKRLPLWKNFKKIHRSTGFFLWVMYNRMMKNIGTTDCAQIFQLTSGGIHMRYGFGIDVGGTTVKIAFFEKDGTMRDKW